MLDLMWAGGLVMVPLLLCSIATVAILLERAWALRRSRVLPSEPLSYAHRGLRDGSLAPEQLSRLRANSPLGRVLAAGLVARWRTLEERKAAMEDAGRAEVVDLERHLTGLGTIAVIAPLLGLLGTVWGLIVVFDHLVAGVERPADLAGGIAQALVTTAFGLIVAIPAVVGHRYYLRRAQVLVTEMEAEAQRLVVALHTRDEGS